jgi:very-short-patch-repair endonuclease
MFINIIHCILYIYCKKCNFMSDLKRFDFKKIKYHARDLRNNPTESEKILWGEIRGRKLSGYKFLRQHPLLYKGNLSRFNYFIADFYCDRKKAVIELDGPIHDSSGDYDDFRDKELEEMGLHILRIKNEELQNMKNTLDKIKIFLNQIPDIK